MEPDLIPYSAKTNIPAEGVLVLAPHADDEAFGCGGAIRNHVVNGVPVCVVVLTDGALYGATAEREDESRAAALVLGYGAPEFWGIPDRGVYCCEELISRVVNQIKSVRADLVYAPSPWEVHPDHRQTAQLAIEALARIGSPVRVIFYEVGAPLRPNVLLDISSEAAVKDRAMACFVSQLKHQDYSQHIRSLNQFRTYTLGKSVVAAEGFLLLSAAELAAIVPTGFFDHVSVGVSPPSAGIETSMKSVSKWPVVTVVVSSADEDYLMGALDSIATQTYPNIEVIVVSRQASHRKLLQRCGRFPLELLATNTRISRSVAGNRGLSAARGAYVVVIDAGDWLMPAHIAQLAGLMSANSAVAAAHTGARWVDAHGKPLSRTVDTAVDGSGRVDGLFLPLCAVMVSSALLRSGCQFDVALPSAGDASFLASICERTIPTHLPGLSAIHRDQSERQDVCVKLEERPLGRSWFSRIFGAFGKR